MAGIGNLEAVLGSDDVVTGLYFRYLADENSMELLSEIGSLSDKTLRSMGYSTSGMGIAEGILYKDLTITAEVVDSEGSVIGKVKAGGNGNKVMNEASEGGKGTNPSVQINGNSYDINKLLKTQPYTYPENVSLIKETIAQNGPNSVPPIVIRVHHGQVLVVDGHHRLEAFRQLGYDRVPIKYLHSSQLGKTLSDGTYYRSIQELLDAARISN